MTPNAPLLLKTLEHIENHPEEWNQESWMCGTTACFAGHAALLDGGEICVDSLDGWFVARDDDPRDALWTLADGRLKIHAEIRARHALALDNQQAERLFSAGNTLDDLRAEVYRLLGDFDKLAEQAERVAIQAINGLAVLPSALADPSVDIIEKFQRWDDLRDAICEWQAAMDGEVDLDTLEPQWRDAEVYTNHLRGLVDDAVHKLIGRSA